MSKIQISFQIMSQDSDQSFDVIGEMKKDRIKFIDPEENTNYIIFHKDTVEYYKRGSVDMKYKFALNTKTEGIYKVYGNQFNFNIVTDKIINDDGIVQIEYRLLQNDELVNTTVLKLTYYFLKEE